MHIRMRDLIASARPEPRGQGRMIIDERPWQAVLDIQAQLVRYLRAIGEPGDEGFDA